MQRETGFETEGRGRFAYTALILGILLPSIVVGAPIIEPTFDLSGAGLNPGVPRVNLCGGVPTACMPLQNTRFGVTNMLEAIIAVNNTAFTIFDLHLKIVAPAGTQWGDVDGDGKVGSSNIFTDEIRLSADKTTIWFSGGTIPPGGQFTDFKKVAGLGATEQIVIDSHFTVPEPSTMALMLLGMAAIGVRTWRRSPGR